MKTQHDIIRSIMQRQRWWTPLNLQRAYHSATGKWLLDSTITRRLREMRDVICEREVVDGKQRWKYRLESKGSNAA